MSSPEPEDGGYRAFYSQPEPVEFDVVLPDDIDGEADLRQFLLDEAPFSRQAAVRVEPAFLPDGVTPGATNLPDSGQSADRSGNDGSGDLRALQAQVWRNKIAKGFNVADMAVEFGLLTAEVSEAFLAWRRGLPDLGEELADVAIYTLGLAEMAGVDLGGEVARKVAINADRVYEPDGGGVMRRVVEDDDTIERLAAILAKADGWFPWDQPVDVEQEVAVVDDVKDGFRSMARAVVRALRETGK